LEISNRKAAMPKSPGTAHRAGRHFPISSFEFRISSFGFRISNFQSPISSLGFSSVEE
jgi:hypothetical protein